MDAAEIEAVFRAEYGRAVSVLVRSLGSIDAAEDAVQDAFVQAARRWPVDGRPASPAGWIITTARRRAIDQARREAVRAEKHAHAAALLAPAGGCTDAADGGGGAGASDEEGVVGDDRLRLMFTCCHPALGRPAQVALTLRLLGG